jgi:hypothetical protein
MILVYLTLAGLEIVCRTFSMPGQSMEESKGDDDSVS